MVVLEKGRHELGIVLLVENSEQHMTLVSAFLENKVVAFEWRRRVEGSE